MAEIRQNITEEALPDDKIENTFQPGPLTKYMEIHELVQLLQSPYSMLDEIPRGRKDGMYYIIENTSNVERRKNGNSSQF